ncbi:hypothetical protein AGMMS4956_08310 [Bacteroidia bacterium]|nr:hypothetical protein AGMMS4956_08310 [Bacteroidia bacterium]
MWTDWQKKVKPDATIPKYLLWDMNLDEFDMQKGRALVVERVIQRGAPEDFYTIFKMYGGVKGVRQIIQNEIYHLHPRDIAFVCATFDLKKEKLECYKRRRPQVVPWPF